MTHPDSNLFPSSKNNPRQNILKHPFVWTATTYFAEGLPYSIVRQISSVFLKDHQATLQAIGLTSLYGLSWTLKFLWAPFIEKFGTKRTWACLMQALLAVLAFAMAFASALTQALQIVSVLFFIMAVLSATNDIATDGYYMEALDKPGQARFLGHRVMGYRLALIAGFGGISLLVDKTSWFVGFGVLGIMLALAALFHYIFLPKAEEKAIPIKILWSWMLSGKRILFFFYAVSAIISLLWLLKSDIVRDLTAPLQPYTDRVSTSGWIALALLFFLLCLLVALRPMKQWATRSESLFGQTFVSFLDQPKIISILLFIVLYRAGESLLSAMSAPFILDMGISKSMLGIISGTIGTICSIVGTILGGWLVSRFDLARTIWPITIIQNITNLVYMSMAYRFSELIGNPGPDSVNILLVGGVHALDQLAGGMGTSVFVTFLMRACKEDHKASHFAIVSGLMTVCGTLMGAVSGFIAASIGYALFFGISFLASIPGMILICYIPFLSSDTKPGA
ncbi:MAG: MFS transporter [Pseudomonadota bacterium]